MYNIPVISTTNILVLICTAVPFSPLFYTSFNIYDIPFFSTINILVLIWFSMQRTHKEILVRTKVGRGKTSLQEQYSSNNYVLKHNI